MCVQMILCRKGKKMGRRKSTTNVDDDDERRKYMKRKEGDENELKRKYSNKMHYTP